MSSPIDKELNIVKMVAEMAQKKYTEKLTPKTLDVIRTVEKFIKDKNLICYGGIAINNILPKRDQFYKSNEFPDYDFFSNDALNHAKELADIYSKAGFGNVEAKSGMHYGTYKVYVNFLNIADITQLDDVYYENLKKSAKVVQGIMYCPPDFLRMSLYLELSRPKGDVSRWEKIFPRLRLLNKKFPIKNTKCKSMKGNIDNKIYDSIKNILIDQKCIFIGGLAQKIYKKYTKNKIANYNTFDVIGLKAENISDTIKKKHKDLKVNIESVDKIGELIPKHYKIIIDNICYANIYQSDACYSYNRIKIGKKIVNIGTIFTILSFYLIFLFAGEKEYDSNRILCTSHIIQNIYLRNRLKNSGILKVFTIQCEGKQETLEDILLEKREKFKTLKRNSKDYEKWFLKYVPKGNSKNKTVKKTKGNSKTKRGGKHTRDNKTFYYVYMVNCPYCTEFDDSGIFEKLRDEFDDINFEKINGPDNPDFCQKYGIGSYPKLMTIENGKHKIFPSDDRNLKDLRKFIM
jgi:hypothetical protein